jgi:hypothetical protein
MAAFSAEHLTAFSCLANFSLSSMTVTFIALASGHAAITITTSASTPLGLLLCSILISFLSLLHLQLEQVLRRMQPDTLTTLNRHLSILMLAVPLYAAYPSTLSYPSMLVLPSFLPLDALWVFDAVVDSD